jgi:hypothetical protein
MEFLASSAFLKTWYGGNMGKREAKYSHIYDCETRIRDDAIAFHIHKCVPFISSFSTLIAFLGLPYP